MKRQWLIAAAVLVPIGLSAGCKKKTTEPVQTGPDQTQELGAITPPAGGASDMSSGAYSEPTMMPSTAPPGGMAPAGAGRVHVVQKGEGLMQIARQYYNGDASKWKLIRDANHLPDDRIKVGQQLVIP